MSFLDRLTRRLVDAAAVFVAVMMLVTIADVLMKNVFRLPISGTFEIVELALVFAIFLGVPETFRSQSNVVVDVADHFLRPEAVAALKRGGTLATLSFLLLLGWAVLTPARDTLDYPQFTQEAGISLTVFWVPILAGIALTIVCTAAVVVRDLRRGKARDMD